MCVYIGGSECASVWQGVCVCECIWGSVYVCVSNMPFHYQQTVVALEQGNGICVASLVLVPLLAARLVVASLLAAPLHVLVVLAPPHVVAICIATLDSFA